MYSGVHNFYRKFGMGVPRDVWFPVTPATFTAVVVGNGRQSHQFCIGALLQVIKEVQTPQCGLHSITHLSTICLVIVSITSFGPTQYIAYTVTVLTSVVSHCKLQVCQCMHCNYECKSVTSTSIQKTLSKSRASVTVWHHEACLFA